MASYGRNFDIPVPPDPRERQGRFILADTADVAIGAPVMITDDDPDTAFTDAMTVELVTGAQAPPLAGEGGILVYEHIDMNGYDPVLNGYSDRGDAPAGRLVQVVRGVGVQVLLRNTEDRTFLQSRSYDGRVMVAGLGATPTLAVGDFLTPGVGDTSDGFWAETASEANAWLRITRVDADRGEVQAALLF